MTGRDHAREIELLRGQHAIDIAVPVLRAEGLRGGLGLGGIDVADGGEARPLSGQALPGMEVVLGEEAAADHPDAQWIRHVSIPS